ncbi:APC family permease [Ferrimicrobium sp.]|uniref:APC family permease n=1 Tax=Ferrimicrobium sp. TaxID=2926050 RepID=UPI002604C9A1|nr:amino acid permease [Ferrimicrobium sp.]
MADQQHIADSHDLASFGYKQHLHRSLGTFSSFAAGYSYISVLTGMFELFGFGYAFGGPRMFWMWLLVWVGQMAVAFCFAELASRYPIAGSVYQWSKQLNGAIASWMTGWVMLVGDVVTVAAVAIAEQIVLPSIWSGFEVFKNTTQNAVFLGVVVLVITTLLNMSGVQIMSIVNNIGVVAELVGVAVFVVLLAFHFQRGPAVVLHAEGTGPGIPGYSIFGGSVALLLAVIMPAYVMYGFDTACTLAEETKDPRRKGPKAILTALAASGLGGALLLLFAIMASPTLNPAKLGIGGLPYIIEAALGATLGKIMLADVAVAIFVCTLAIQTATIRLTFSMARDNNLPFGNVLSRVSKKVNSPIVPSIISGVVAALILIVNIGKPQIFTIVTSVAIIFVYVAYFMVTGSLLFKRGKRGMNQKDKDGLFSMGKWGPVVNGVAFFYGVLMSINLIWPRTAIYGPGVDAWGGVIVIGVVVVLGYLYYQTVQKRKYEAHGIVADHRAESSSEMVD